MLGSDRWHGVDTGSYSSTWQKGHLRPNMCAAGSPSRKYKVLTNSSHITRQKLLPSAKLFFSDLIQGVPHNGFFSLTLHNRHHGFTFIIPSWNVCNLKEIDREYEVNQKELNYY